MRKAWVKDTEDEIKELLEKQQARALRRTKGGSERGKEPGRSPPDQDAALRPNLGAGEVLTSGEGGVERHLRELEKE